jgi:predicted enzyme related to lactoylglutathione lyase
MHAFNPVGWFEIPAVDLAVSQKFYQLVLQTQFDIVDMPPYTMAMFARDDALPGCGGALVVGPETIPSTSGTTIYFQSEDCATVIARVEAAGGTVLMEKTSIGEYGFIAMFLDPAGNKLGVHSMQ